MVRVPRPVSATALLVAASLLGDGAMYVVLPVLYAQRGLRPMDVGLLLSANRWMRLLTNDPAAYLLGTRPIRSVFAGALLIGGACSLCYAATTSLLLLLCARAAWGACWSVIRLVGLLTVTDCVDAGLASESIVGRMTGHSAGLSRLGAAVGMAAGGWLCDRVGFSGLFVAAGVGTIASSALVWRALGPLPRVSSSAAARLKKRATVPTAPGVWRCLSRFKLSGAQAPLFVLAFASSCAGNGMIVSTLGAVLASHADVDPDGERSVLRVGSAAVETATLTGVLLGARWAIEGGGAPLYGRLVDRLGWRRMAPASFALSSANGLLGWGLLRSAELAADATPAVLLVGVLCSVVLFFFLASAADLTVKAMGVAWREAPLLVQGCDLGAAVGPVLGYALLESGLPASSVLAAQSLVHGVAAIVAISAARRSPSGAVDGASDRQELKPATGRSEEAADVCHAPPLGAVEEDAPQTAV